MGSCALAECVTIALTSSDSFCAFPWRRPEARSIPNPVTQTGRAGAAEKSWPQRRASAILCLWSPPAPGEQGAPSILLHVRFTARSQRRHPDKELAVRIVPRVAEVVAQVSLRHRS